MAESTLVLPLDDEERLTRVFEKHGDQLAAVIIEPLPANNGLLIQRPDFLELLRRLCTRHGVLLIFDEVITGLRMPAGSYGREVGVEPDLYTLGKVIGGGLPVGAYAGPAQLMDQVSPLGPVYQAGTLSGNPVAIAAGLATLAELERRDGWRRLGELGRFLEDELGPRLERSRHAVRLVRVESLFWLSFGDELPKRADQLSSAAAPLFAQLHAALLDRGFMLAPSAFEVGFLSLAHDEQTIARFCSALEESLEAIEPVDPGDG